MSCQTMSECHSTRLPASASHSSRDRCGSRFDVSLSLLSLTLCCGSLTGLCGLFRLVAALCQYLAFLGDFDQLKQYARSKTGRHHTRLTLLKLLHHSPTIWPHDPPSLREDRSSPFHAFGRRVSATSSFEAITPDDLAYERPWTTLGLPTPVARPPAHGYKSVDPISAQLIPFEGLRTDRYTTVSIHQDSPYALSAADLGAQGVALPAPALYLPPHTQFEPPALQRAPSSASLVSQYPPTPNWQSAPDRFEPHIANGPQHRIPDVYTPPSSRGDLLAAVQGLYAPGVERRGPPEYLPEGQQAVRFHSPSRPIT